MTQKGERRRVSKLLHMSGRGGLPDVVVAGCQRLREGVGLTGRMLPYKEG